MDLNESLNLNASRRNFIKAAGATVFAGAAAAMLGGCSAKGHEENKNNAANSIDEIEWDEETDVLIVGGGLAGKQQLPPWQPKATARRPCCSKRAL